MRGAVLALLLLLLRVLLQALLPLQLCSWPLPRAAGSL
jgi:hypothetical protein